MVQAKEHTSFTPINGSKCQKTLIKLTLCKYWSLTRKSYANHQTEFQLVAHDLSKCISMPSIHSLMNRFWVLFLLSISTSSTIQFFPNIPVNSPHNTLLLWKKIFGQWTNSLHLTLSLIKHVHWDGWNANSCSNWLSSMMQLHFIL